MAGVLPEICGFLYFRPAVPHHGYLYTGVPPNPSALRPDELQRVARGAESYQEKAKMYKLQLEG